MSKSACKAVICLGKAVGTIDTLKNLAVSEVLAYSEDESELEHSIKQSELIVKRVSKLIYDLDEIE